MSKELRPHQITMYAETACLGCGEHQRVKADYHARAAAALRKIGWRYVDRDGRCGWSCPNCLLDQFAAETRRLREATRVRP